jgi:hypothetical protein
MKAFVAMPFNPIFLNVWRTIRSACEANGIEAIRVDQIPQVDDIWKAIVEEIKTSDLIIVDFSGDEKSNIPNPNVITEATYARTYQKPVIILTQNVASLPFDWKTYRATIYENTEVGLTYIREMLTENLGALLKRLIKGKKPSKKRRSGLNWEQFEQLAEKNGVLPLYITALASLRPFFNSTNRTRSNIALIGYIDKSQSRTTIISIYPGRSAPSLGLAVEIMLERLCEYFSISKQHVLSIVGEQRHGFYGPLYYFDNEKLSKFVEFLAQAKNNRKQSQESLKT